MIRMTTKQARECGMDVPKKAGKRAKATIDAKAFQRLFDVACEAHGIPKPHYEFRFQEGRKRAFDVAWPEQKVALEIQGGLWVEGGGRHQRGAALLDEHAKLNAAAIAQWRILFCAPQQVESGEVFQWIADALGTVERTQAVKALRKFVGKVPEHAAWCGVVFDGSSECECNSSEKYKASKAIDVLEGN